MMIMTMLILMSFFAVKMMTITTSITTTITGTTFMAETLNDVLSLQKIEDGQMTLDKIMFKPESLLKSAMMTFK